MPDAERRDLQRRGDESPDDADLATRLLNAEDRDEVPFSLSDAERGHDGLGEALRDRALNEDDSLAQRLLERDQESQQSGGAVPVALEVPAAPGIAGYDVKMPLCERQTFGKGDRLAFFLTSPIPDWSVFKLFEILLLVDAGSDVALAERLWNEGKARLSLSRQPWGEWPVRLLLPPPRRIPTALLPRAKMLFALRGRDVTVAGKPLVLVSQELWGFELECGGVEGLSVMACLLGITSRAST